MKQAAVWIVEVQVFGGAWEPRRLAATKAIAVTEKKRLAIKPARVKKYVREEEPVGYSKNGVFQ